MEGWSSNFPPFQINYHIIEQDTILIYKKNETINTPDELKRQSSIEQRIEDKLDKILLNIVWIEEYLNINPEE